MSEKFKHICKVTQGLTHPMVETRSKTCLSGNPALSPPAPQKLFNGNMCSEKHQLH